MDPHRQTPPILAVRVPAERLAPLQGLGAHIVEADAAPLAKAGAAELSLVVTGDPSHIQELRAAFPSTPLLVLTRDEATLPDVVQAGADYALPATAPAPLLVATYLAARREATQRRQRGVDVGIHLASVAHDINNPLQCILTSVEELLDVGVKHPEARQLLSDIRESAARIGAVARALLPARRDAERERASQLARARVGTTPRRMRRALVIDDEELLVRAYKRCLTEFDVVTAVGGAAAIDVLSSDVDFDVILCDVMMPNIDGPMIHEHIRNVAPHLESRILYCTGGVFNERVRRFLEKIENVVLEKPLTAAELRDAVDRLLSGR